MSRAVARAAAVAVSEMPGAYLAALSAGSDDVGLSRARELRLGPSGLVVLALVRMRDLFLYCHLLEACDLDGSSERLPAPAVARVRVLAGAVLRLAHRALESHLLAAGDASRYETTIRLTHACTRAAALLDDSAAKPEGPAVLLEQAHFALWALGEAAAATAEPNPAVVCERLVDAIARLLVVFIVVSPLSADRPAPQLAEA